MASLLSENGLRLLGFVNRKGPSNGSNESDQNDKHHLYYKYRMEPLSVTLHFACVFVLKIILGVAILILSFTNSWKPPRSDIILAGAIAGLLLSVIDFMCQNSSNRPAWRVGSVLVREMRFSPSCIDSDPEF